MDPATTRIRLRRRWDAGLERTARLHPAGCHAALVDWQPEPWPDNGGMPAEVALALAPVLAGLGTVIGRAEPGELASPPATLIPPPGRGWLAWLRDGVLRRTRAAPLACTRDAGQVAALLDCGWSVQQQAILVISPDGVLDGAVAALRHRGDWRDYRVAPPVELLVVPSNDGDGALLAAPSAAALDAVLAQVERAARAAGFPVSRQARAASTG